MRLIHVHDFTLKSFQIPPPYAILSHRWQPPETTITDIQDSRVNESSSNKVSNFAKYVKSQFANLEWIWVDTCCIDQKNLPEVQEAVNCMFDWYRNAAVCVVYLHDVEHASDEVTLRSSVWFTRGWTLQELLASTVAVFLTTGWQVIGHKGKAAHLGAKVGHNIETLLAERTRVPLAVLQDMSVSRSLSVEERLRWIDGRETERPEDMSYSLFGIFDVAPGINYGEKEYRARQRLIKAIDEEHEKAQKEVVKHAAWTEMNVAEIDVWLSPADPSLNHESARESCELGTCAWLLQREQYKRWKAGTTRHLWLHGKPGCGKSVLCSTVIEDLKIYCLDHPKTVLAYFYFTFSDDHKQNYDDLILSLVAQFGRREPARSILRQLHDKNRHSRPSIYELEKILTTVVESFDEVFVVLDALDESPETGDKRRSLFKRLKKLISQTTKLRMFATSRYIPDILAFVKDLACQQISIQPSDVSSDIQLYVVKELSTEPRLRQFTPAVKSMIERNVSQSVDGMFRWAFLLLDQLSRLRKANLSTIEAALKKFPKDLDEIYARILQDLEENDQQDVITLLRWITYAREPLSLSELIDALIIEPENDVVHVDDRCQPEDILRLLTSLVIIIVDSGPDGANPAEVSVSGRTKIRLAHFTVQEYLESNRILKSDVWQFHLEGKQDHYVLQQGCLRYLLNYSSSNDKESTKEDLTRFPLLHYAARSWYYHSSLHEHTDVDLQLKLLQSDARRRDWLMIHQPELPTRVPFKKGGVSIGTTLYYASLLGIETIVKLQLENHADINAEGGPYGNAIEAASVGGHTEIVKLLLDNRADVNAQGGDYGNAIEAASEGGHTEIVKLLLDNRADVNTPGGDYGNALKAASARGHTEIVKLLLDNRADVNAQGGDYSSALQVASRGGHHAIIQLLLNKGADINARGGEFGGAYGGEDGTALEGASYNGHYAIVELLLSKGADIIARGGECNALEAASYGGHPAIVELLLSKSADIIARGGEYGNPLEAASSGGHHAIVELLLSKCADINVRGKEVGDALESASYNGYHAIVELLLSKGADVNAQVGGYGNALQAASLEGYQTIIELLLSKGADINAQGGIYGNALQAASYSGRYAIVELILSKGADINARGGEYRSALEAASARGHQTIVGLLLSRGAKAQGARVMAMILARYHQNRPNG